VTNLGASGNLQPIAGNYVIIPRQPASQKFYTTLPKSLHLVQTSCVAIIFTPHSLGTNGLQLNHTRSMPLYDLEKQYDQAAAVLPIIQRKYYNISLTF
jgi:hypothetical protein